MPLVRRSATGSLVAGLVDSGQENAIKMNYCGAPPEGSNPTPCILTVWVLFAKVGSPASPPMPKASAAAASSESAEQKPVVKRDSLRTARSGQSGMRAVASTSDVKPKSEQESSPKVAERAASPDSGSERTKKVSGTKKKSKDKPEKKEESDDEELEALMAAAKKPGVKAEEEESDEDFVDAPPRRKAKAKPNVVPEDEDPEDFWNGTSKSKTQEKKKNIKKLQQSLESMTINLKSSWKSGTHANEQQRFSVMIRDIAEVNSMTRAAAGFSKSSDGLKVRIAFAVDLPQEKASGCGIDSDKWICLELLFENGIYLSKEPSAANKTIKARQVFPIQGDQLMATSQLSQFGFWWTVEQRLSETLANEWSKVIETANQVTKKADNEQSTLGSPDAWAMLEILEWPTSNLQLAVKALAECKEDVKLALELALDEDWLTTAKAELDSNQKKKKKKKKSKGTEDAEATKAEEIEKADEVFERIVSEAGSGSSFLTYLIQETSRLLEDSTKSCPICNTPHPLELFKPIVCGNELCKFQFSNMGLGADFESELIHSPNAVDLLILMTSRAIAGSHFEPFPHEVSTQVSGVTMGLKTPQDVSQVLQKCPSVDDMIVHAQAGTLRSHLAELHPLLYLLLRWIITSSRAHLHFLDSENKVPIMHTDYQFHLKSSPPEKEQKFYAAKKRYGSFYAWHGSPDYNWHSILRNGLRNYSKSKHQLHGAAYGPGVYMAVDSGTSTGYSRVNNFQPVWPRSRYPTDTNLLALCEVIDEGSTICTGNVHRPKCLHSPSAPYYRIEKDEYITTRYLFVVTPNCTSVYAKEVAGYIKSKQLLRSNKGRSKPH